MTVLPSLDISIYSDGSLRYKRLPVAPAPRFIGWRFPHDTERTNYDLKQWDYPGNGPVRLVAKESGKPEVYRVGDWVTLLSPAWVRLWRDLNPELDDKHFCTLLDNHLAWTNNTGWPGRKNIILGTDLDQKDPAFHACLINGGAYLQGFVAGDYLYPDTLRTGGVVPPADVVLSMPWLWFWGTNITPEGRINYIVRLGRDGTLKPVRVPLITSQVLKIPTRWLQRWDGDAVPDPLKVYR